MTQHGQGVGAEAVRTGHEAFNDRDRDALLAVIAEDVTWHAGGNNPASGTYEGRDALWEGFFSLFWEAPVRVEDHDILDSGEHVVGLSNLVFDLGDEQRTWRLVEVVHYNDDGKVTERWDFTERQAELDQFIRQLVQSSSGAE